VSRISGNLAWVGMVWDGLSWLGMCISYAVISQPPANSRFQWHSRNYSFHKYVNSLNSWKCSKILKVENKWKLEFPASTPHVKMFEYAPLLNYSLCFWNVLRFYIFLFSKLAWVDVSRVARIPIHCTSSCASILMDLVWAQADDVTIPQHGFTYFGATHHLLWEPG
jgi:hypothetical protein